MVDEYELSLIKKAENKLGALMVLVGVLLMLSIYITAFISPDHLIDVGGIGGFIFCFNFGAFAGVVMIRSILKEA